MIQGQGSGCASFSASHVNEPNRITVPILSLVLEPQPAENDLSEQSSYVRALSMNRESKYPSFIVHAALLLPKTVPPDLAGSFSDEECSSVKHH